MTFTSAVAEVANLLSSQAFPHNLSCELLELTIRQVLFSCPCNFSSITARMQFAAGDSAEEINQHVVILRLAFFAGNNAVQDFQNLSGFDHQPGFFQRFTLSCGSQSLADLDHATWQRPFSLKRRCASLYQNHAIVFNNDCADANDWPVWIFALHGCSEKKLRGWTSVNFHVPEFCIAVK